jgi:hypothetical protein
VCDLSCKLSRGLVSREVGGGPRGGGGLDGAMVSCSDPTTWGTGTVGLLNFPDRSLVWSRNPYLTSIAPGGLVGLSRLQYLDLRSNAITGVVDWSGLTALTYVPHRMDLNGGYL